jgi:hypothetical protein
MNEINELETSGAPDHRAAELATNPASVSGRAAELAATQDLITRTLLEQEIIKNPIRTVLFETFHKGIATGHTDSFIEVSAISDTDIRGKYVDVRLLKVENGKILGEIIKNKDFFTDK